MSLSDDILADNADVLDRMLRHRFVEDICADRLPARVFDRYLMFEGAFVETAITIFAFATARAPDLETQRHLIGVQDSLANFQIPYFEACFARRSTRIGGTAPPAAKALETQMLALAQTGSFATIITAMFAAEWMYATWCNRAATHPITDPDIREWVDLHAHPDFAAQARWLKDAIDTYADPGEREALSATYHAVIEEEIVFHDAPYGDPAETAG